jgi:hypothetical protein
VEGRQVIEHEAVVPDIGFPDVVPDTELPPAPVDIDEVPERREGAAMVEVRRPPELRIREAGRRRQEAVVRSRMEPDEGEQGVAIHPLIVGAATDPVQDPKVRVSPSDLPGLGFHGDPEVRDAADPEHLWLALDV